MSDSHDNFKGVKDALSAFSQRGVRLVLHAGDMIGSGNCYTFEGCNMDLKLVYGNNDGDSADLKRDFERVGGEYLGDFGEVDADGLKIALITDEPLVRALVDCKHYDVIVRGHNHRLEMKRGNTLLINPGEVWGHFSGLSSVAILDSSDMNVDVVELGLYRTFRDLLRS
ncbi:MAG: YfcE family phosphodiesterase [Methanotrichaceae archaeon]|nr:YfcE family phosphodiesterase [Methanotrichaceae archaeon]